MYKYIATYLHTYNNNYSFIYVCTYLSTIDVERLAGLSVCSFISIEVYAEILSHSLGHKYLLFSIIKEKHLYPQKKFEVATLENHENHKSLA